MFTQEAAARLEYEADLRQQLARQAAAHSDHLVSALHDQKTKLQAVFERQLIDGVQQEKERMNEEISAIVNRVNSIEAAVEGPCRVFISGIFPRPVANCCLLKPSDAHCCHMGSSINHPVPDRVKPLFVIFVIWAL